MFSEGAGLWLYRERHFGGKHSDNRGWAAQISEGDRCYDFEPSIVVVVSGKRGLPTYFFFFNWRLITLQYCGGGFCHKMTWISHGCTCVPHPEPPSHLPPHPIPQGCPSAPALSALFHASNLEWWSISHMVIYMFQCYSVKSSHPHLLPQSPKVCSLYLCLFCCLAYRVIITIFLNSIYMC